MPKKLRKKDYSNIIDLAAVIYPNDWFEQNAIRVAKNTTNGLIVVNSPGGDPNAAYNLADYVALNDHTVMVSGLAASAATLIGLEAKRAYITPSSSTMIHQGSGGAYGRADDMRNTAESLDQLNDRLASSYARASQRRKPNRFASYDDAKAFFVEAMKKDTYYNAEQSVELGLVDEIVSFAYTSAPAPENREEYNLAIAALAPLPSQTSNLINNMSEKKTFWGRMNAMVTALGNSAAVPNPEPVAPPSDPKQGEEVEPETFPATVEEDTRDPDIESQDFFNSLITTIQEMKEELMTVRAELADTRAKLTAQNTGRMVSAKVAARMNQVVGGGNDISNTLITKGAASGTVSVPISQNKKA